MNLHVRTRTTVAATVAARDGNFNYGINYGTQTYNEAAQQREVPANLQQLLGGVQKDGLVVQVRVYGMDYEMKSFGTKLANAMASLGFQVRLFGDDLGTRTFKGVIVEPAPNSRARQAAMDIACGLRAGDVEATVNDGPDAWGGQEFVRIAVGANG